MKWIYIDDDDINYHSYKCSNCGKYISVDAKKVDDIGFVIEDFKFCLNCGANMGVDVHTEIKEKDMDISVKHINVEQWQYDSLDNNHKISDIIFCIVDGSEVSPDYSSLEELKSAIEYYKKQLQC